MAEKYGQRMLAIAEELHAQGVGRFTSAPPLYRIAWRLGLRVRPPLYQSAVALAAGWGVWFALGWGLLMWFITWQSQGYSLTRVVLISLCAGVFFGLLMAAMFKRKAAKLQLPPLDGDGTAA